jgi:hypothetical protein
MNASASQRNNDFLKTHRLQTLLWIDEQYHDSTHGESLRECLGDSYLCANNELFAKVRRLFLHLGCRYSSDQENCRDYMAAPLLCLSNLLDNKCVPFFDNTSVLRQTLKRCPELTISTHDLQMQLKKNYLLHESSHCIADALLTEFPDGTGSSMPEEAFVIAALTCESFANIVERIAAVAADYYPHNLFFHLNSYMEYQPQRSRFIHDAVSIFGMENILRFGFLGFFYSNIRPGSPNDATSEGFIRAVFGDTPLSASDRSILRLLGENTFIINGTFREETTALFFRMFHCEEQFKQIAKTELTPETMDRLGILSYMQGLVTALMSRNEAAVAA